MLLLLGYFSSSSYYNFTRTRCFLPSDFNYFRAATWKRPSSNQIWERNVQEMQFNVEIFCLKAHLREQRPASKLPGQKKGLPVSYFERLRNKDDL
jgi:hypothetical protein